MVHIYVWKPLDLADAIAKGLMPDFGHAAMEVVDTDGGSLAYVSFWPEMNTLIGEALQPFKPRETRHPTSYDQESDRDQGYMQRDADFIETLEGLLEERIVAGWPTLRDSTYDLSAWNCSNVCKFLLLHGMDREHAEAISEAAVATLEDLGHIHGENDFWEKIGFLATSPFISCRPEDLLPLARAYNDRVRGLSVSVADEVPDAGTPWVAATGIGVAALAELLPEIAAQAAAPAEKTT